METNHTPWNDSLEIGGDAREDIENSERMRMEFIEEEEAHYREENAIVHGLPKNWENAPESAKIAFLIFGGDNPEEFDALKSFLKGE